MLKISSQFVDLVDDAFVLLFIHLVVLLLLLDSSVDLPHGVLGVGLWVRFDIVVVGLNLQVHPLLMVVIHYPGPGLSA